MRKIKVLFNKLMNLFADQTYQKVIDLLVFLTPLVNEAYPVVKKIAELTPNKVDDQILAAYEHFGVKDVFDPNIDKNEALRNLARIVLKKQTKEPIKDYVANAAIEIAYTQFKQGD